MPPRSAHPRKTLFSLALVAGMGWGAYEYVYKRRIFSPAEAAPVLDAERKEQIRDSLFLRFGNEECFSELSPISYRAKEGRFRIDVVVPDECDDHAKDLCHRISMHVSNEFDITADVWAFDSAGRQMGRWIP